ncbi:MAG TPA: hypothetical protein VG297_01685 [Bryobacteraceae bacterium]|nr:hypothetical protein [Bryobacteraceae bacterium]
MKPLHIGLLVVGAGIAGGLAVKMTQPPSLPSPPPVNVAADVAKSAPPAPPAPPATVDQPVAAPPAETKPSPIPAAAPAAVYNEESKRAPRRNKTENRSAPVLIAKARPTQWLPQPYVPPVAPVEPDATLPTPDPPAPVEQTTLPDPPVAPEPPAPRHVTLPTGMTIAVRLNEPISTDRAMPGDAFWASLAQPLIVDRLVIAERGARVSGRITSSERGGRVGGSAILTLALSTISTSDGQRVSISTDPWTRQGDSSRNEDVAKIGGGAALGAIIGAIAGGGKGAAIGAGIGGGAGAGAAIATRGRAATVPAETVINFRLASRVTITEQIAAR